MQTARCSLRADVDGWTCEDSGKLLPDKPIGFTRGPDFSYTYRTVMHALHDGWKLLAPPEMYLDRVEKTPAEVVEDPLHQPFREVQRWEWWFVRDGARDGRYDE